MNQPLNILALFFCFLSIYDLIFGSREIAIFSLAIGIGLFIINLVIDLIREKK